MKWITALDLSRWADTTGARTALSELVSALIRATAPDIRSFRFPTGDSAQIPGYDGRLSARGVEPYVADGESVWEFGVGTQYLDKANEDFQRRTNAPGDIVKSETTFVFVTPRTWAIAGRSIEDWCREKKSQSDWKDVKVIDGVGLEDWLAQRHAVAARAARTILGIMPAMGARSIDEFWDEYAWRFRPPLIKDVLLCEREEQAKQLIGQLSGEPRDIVVRGDSPDEVIAFVIAAIRSAEPEVQKFLEARTLILDTDEAARRVNQQSKTIFIVRGTAVSLGGWLARYSITIVPTGRDTPQQGVAFVLNRPTTYALRDAITKMGFREEEAYQLARTCGRSVTVLARRIPRGDAGKPPWADGQRTLLPALLAGGWDANSPDDQAIVSVLAGGIPYPAYEATLHPLERLPDPPIDREGNVWKIRAPVDAFIYLAPLIGRIDLDQLRAAATEVFSEYDPSLDLPEEERPYAVMKRKRLRHSEWLRDGLATTLLLMAALHKEAELRISGTTPQEFVDQVINGLPGLGRDYRLLASLRSELPLLMEAAPRPLLATLEHLLEGDGSAMRAVFREGGFLGPTSPHTYFLWALEMLTWDPEYLDQVAVILARLARVDPGGTYHNRPLNSLKGIFLSWHPGTNATLGGRMAALDRVIALEPEIGWQLLVGLFPEHHGVAHPTAKPRYREAGSSEREVLTWARVFEGYREVVRRALQLANNDPARWTTIIKEMSNFEPPLRQQTYELLRAFVESGAGGDRQAVWSALREEVTRHRSYATAEWALKEPELAQLDGIVRVLEPDDVVQRVAWLFNDQFPDVASAEDERRIEAVGERRAEAISQICGTGGAAAIVRLAAAVEYPQFVASSAGHVLHGMDEYEALIVSSLGQSERLNTFALALSGEAERRFSEEWRARIGSAAVTRGWGPGDVATLLLGWRDGPTTWEVAARFGPEVKESYWRRKFAWPLHDSQDETLVAAVKNFLSVGRATAALDVIEREVHRLPVGLVFEVLDSVVTELSSAAGKGQLRATFGYHLGEVLDELARRDDASPFEVAKREYAVLPLLGHRERTLTLHRVMAERAEFFVSILCDVFRPSSGERPEPTDEHRARAQIGFDFINSFRLLPGLRDGDVDLTALRRWIEDVRRLSAEADRADIAEEYIGHVLAHAPSDPADHAWPHRAVRDVIEELHSDRIEEGIRVERFNMRGVVSKAVFEGGGQERALAEQTRGWAATGARWPRTAATLRRIARMWDAEGDREDERARQDQMRRE